MVKKTFLASVVVLVGIIAFSGLSWAAVLWFENWDGSPEDNWSFEGNWQSGVPTAGPTDVISPPDCAATNLDGDYPNYADYRLVRFSPFEVPAAEQNPRLVFWHWYDFDSDSNDYGVLQIKVGSDPWISISNAIYFTSCGRWIQSVVDLSDYAGQSVQIAFYFHSNSNTVAPGWYIDNVEIHPLGGEKFSIDIKANGSDKQILVKPNENIVATIQLTAGPYEGAAADWWIGLLSTSGNYWLNEYGNWIKSETPVLYSQEDVHDLAETVVLDSQLGSGIYTLMFLMDSHDGQLMINKGDYLNIISKW
jgi:hypothetical protein